MITIDLAQWTAWLDTFLYPLIRIASFIAFAPILGESQVPARVKIGLAVILTVALQSQFPAGAAFTPDSWQGLATGVNEALIGIALAISARLVFAALQATGAFVGLEMDLSFASFFDAASDGNTDVTSRLFNVIGLLLFVTANGHLLLIQGLAQTFSLLPPAHLWDLQGGAGALIEASSIIFTAGLTIALPMVALLLLINLMLGILNRTAQQLSVFSVGFPVAIATGLFVLAQLLPVMQPTLERLTLQSISLMSEVARQLADAP